MLNYENLTFTKKAKVLSKSALFIQCIFASIHSASLGGAIQMTDYKSETLITSECIFDDCCTRLSHFEDSCWGGAIFAFLNNNFLAKKSCFVECHSDIIIDTIFIQTSNESKFKSEVNNCYFDFGKCVATPIGILYSKEKPKYINLNCTSLELDQKFKLIMEKVKFSYFLNMDCTFDLEFVDSCVFEKCNCSEFNAKLITCCSFIDFINENCVFNITIDPSKPLYSDKNISSLMNSIVVTKDVPVPKIEETLYPVLNI